MDPTIKKMIHGFKHFQKAYYSDSTELYSQLKTGQMPGTLMIACCDSRVDPAHVTQCSPGDMFVIRNVANLVPPYHPDLSYHGVSSAIEYAVCDLQVKHIIVLGHSNCGGINTLMSKDWHNHSSEFLSQWLSLAEPARKRVKERLGELSIDIQMRACEETSILLSMENLMTFPWIKDRVETGKLKIHGWYFNMDNGEMYDYDFEKEEFSILNDNPEPL